MLLPTGEPVGRAEEAGLGFEVLLGGVAGRAAVVRLPDFNRALGLQSLPDQGRAVGFVEGRPLQVGLGESRPGRVDPLHQNLGPLGKSGLGSPGGDRPRQIERGSFGSLGGSRLVLAEGLAEALPELRSAQLAVHTSPIRGRGLQIGAAIVPVGPAGYPSRPLEDRPLKPAARTNSAPPIIYNTQVRDIAALREIFLAR